MVENKNIVFYEVTHFFNESDSLDTKSLFCWKEKLQIKIYEEKVKQTSNSDITTSGGNYGYDYQIMKMVESKSKMFENNFHGIF